MHAHNHTIEKSKETKSHKAHTNKKQHKKNNTNLRNKVHELRITNYKDTNHKHANHITGVAKIGMINCDEHKDLCQEMNVGFYPQLRLFKRDQTGATGNRLLQPLPVAVLFFGYNC